MNNLKDLEKLMAKKSRLVNAEYDMAYNNMAIYLRVYDKEYMTCHCKIINTLYNFNKRPYTYERIACDMNTNDNTLRRYRNWYTHIFSSFMELQQESVSFNI